MKTITGIVQPGRQKSNQTGMPTANLDIALAGGLERGVYNCQVAWDEKKYNGLLYYGHNSLTNQDCLEVHLLNFSGDLYGEEINITIGQFIRPEKRFDRVEDLAEEMHRDLKNLTS